MPLLRKLKRLPRLRWLLLPLFLVLLLSFVPTADCLFRDNWVVREGRATDEFSALPGMIGVTFKASYESPYRGEHKYLQFRAGHISWARSLPRAIEHSRGPTSWSLASAPPGVPGQSAELTVRAPYALSPDGRLAATGAHNVDDLFLYMEQHSLAVPHDASVLLIMSLETGQELARVDSGFQWQVEGLAWSPDGQYLAVLRLEAQWALCLREAYFFLYGMRTHLFTYNLDVYDLNGRLIASQKLLSRGKWFGEIVWTE